MSNIMKSKISALARQIDEKLASNSRKITFITRSIIEWVIYSLTTGSKWSGRLKPSSLISYLASISKSLQLYFGYRDPLEMELEEIAHIYLMIIDDGRNVAVKARRARILRDFHEVLEVKYKVEPCYIFQEFITTGNNDKINLVDANILMPWEYETATAFLAQSNELTGLTEIQRKAVHVALILGFRCGFRRSELHYLKIQDLEWDLDNCETIPDWATILISYSELRDLKSISAHRRLPVGLLLNKQELCVLNDYCRLRLKLTLEYSDFLFYFDKPDPLLGRDLQVVSANQLFTPLTDLLQRVTGDNTFRYHHLRHSFATWLFWYWTGDIHKFSHPIPTLQKHPIFEHLFTARKVLLHRAPDEPSRKTLHTISSLIGHSGPSITLFHYIHSAAWIIWSDLQQQLPDTSAGFSDAVRAALTNVTTRTLYRKNEDSENCSAYFDGFLRFIHSELSRFANAIDTSTWSSINFTAIEALSSEVPFKVSEITLYKALLEFFNGGLARHKCIAMFSVDENAFNHSINNVRYFFSQRQSRYPQGKKSNASKNHERRDYIQGKNVNKLPERKLKKLPKSKASLNLILRIISRYHELPDEQKRVILLAAKFMVDFCSVEWSDIRLSLNDSLQPSGHYWLKTWLDAIKLLDEGNDLYKYVRLTLVCRHPIGSSEREYYWEAWTNGLLIPNRDDRHHKNYPKKALIRLDIMDFLEFEGAIDGKRRRRAPSKKIYRVPSQQGFRLALYIIFFIYHIE
jgi:integrase